MVASVEAQWPIVAHSWPQSSNQEVSPHYLDLVAHRLANAHRLMPRWFPVDRPQSLFHHLGQHVGSDESRRTRHRPAELQQHTPSQMNSRKRPIYDVQSFASRQATAGSASRNCNVRVCSVPSVSTAPNSSHSIGCASHNRCLSGKRLQWYFTPPRTW
jgi:hypothetical protein